VLLGLVIPLVLALAARSGATSLPTMWLAALLCIQGALCCRWGILRAGVYAPAQL